MPTVAAGLTYYAVLSIFPALIVFVALIGIFGEYPATSDAILDIVRQVGPAEAVDTLDGTIEGVVRDSGGAGALLGVGLLGALYSASGYIGAFFKASNTIYGVEEDRGFVKLKAIQFGLTLVFLIAAAISAVAFVASGSVAESLFDKIGLGSTALDVWSYAKWPVLALVVIALIALLYWIAPNVEQPKLRWLTPGGAVALLLLVVASALFGLYVANFGSYDKTYGTLAFVPLFMTWLWIANLGLLFGAEFDTAVLRTKLTETSTREGDDMSDDEKQEIDSDEVDQQIKEIEENPPDRLEDYPDGPAKYRTIGGSDANEDWDEGPTKHLGPADLRYHDDGSITIKGEKVDNPDDYKGEPIPGGPTDPDAPDDPSGLSKNEAKD